VNDLPEEGSGLRTKIGRLVRSPTVSSSTTGLAVYGLAAITGPLLARSLGPSGRGDLAAVLVPSEMLGWIVTFGLPAAALYYADRYSIRQMVMAAWVFAVVVGGGLTLAVWFYVPSYLHEHDQTTVPWLRIFLLLTILFVPTMTTIQLLRLRTNLVAFNFFRSLQLVLETLMIVVLALVGRLDLTSALWAALGSSLVAYVAVLAYGKGWPARTLNRRALRDMVHYGARLSIGNMANLLINRLDQLVMVGLVAPAQLGIYAIAATAAGVSSAAADGVSFVVFARMRETRDPKQAWSTLVVGLRWTFLASCAIGLVIGLASSAVIPLLFGSAFKGAVVPLLILLPGQIVADLGKVVSQKLLVDNRPGAVSHAFVFAAVVAVVGLYLLVGRFGINGAASATTASQIVFAAYVMAVATRLNRNGASAAIEG
jgi:O-antigen/teichoic acid export membrane protein